MLESLHRSIIGDKLYPFVESIDYNGFLSNGGTSQLWEECINALYDGFPGYTGEGDYNKYLDKQSKFLNDKYRAFDAKNSPVEVVE